MKQYLFNKKFSKMKTSFKLQIALTISLVFLLSNAHSQFNWQWAKEAGDWSNDY